MAQANSPFASTISAWCRQARGRTTNALTTHTNFLRSSKSTWSCKMLVPPPSPHTLTDTRSAQRESFISQGDKRGRVFRPWLNQRFNTPIVNLGYVIRTSFITTKCMCIPTSKGLRNLVLSLNSQTQSALANIHASVSEHLQ
jgi:hypothetical protein